MTHATNYPYSVPKKLCILCQPPSKAAPALGMSFVRNRGALQAPLRHKCTNTAQPGLTLTQ